MSQINPVAQQSVRVTAPSSSHPATAAAVASTHGGQELTSSSTIKSLADLKKKSPKVYNMMMLGIATSICQEMEHRQAELKKLMREGQRRD